MADALENLTPEERHRFYKMLGLKVTVGADGSVEIDGTFVVDGPLELGKAFEDSEGERALVSTETADKRGYQSPLFVEQLGSGSTRDGWRVGRPPWPKRGCRSLPAA